jgi:hypothetical protein
VVFEIGNNGKLQRLRVYFDRLGIEQQVAKLYSGARGVIGGPCRPAAGLAS